MTLPERIDRANADGVQEQLLLVIKRGAVALIADLGYATAVRSAVTAGGTITGVDESIRVTVHTLPAQGPVGTYCCRAAGGTRSPWSARVSFRAAPGQVIIIAAATGGHAAAVERIAVTGARVG